MSSVSSKSHQAGPDNNTTPANSGRAALLTVAVTTGIFFLGQLLAGVILAIVPFLVGWSPAQAQAWLGTTSGQFTFVVFAEAFTLALLWWFMRRHRLSIKSLGFYRRPAWADVTYVLVGFVVYIGLLIVATTLAGNIFGVNTDQKQELGFDNVVGVASLVMTFVSLVVLPPLTEEIIARGFLYGRLRTKLSFGVSTLVTSALFALPHLFQSGDSGLLWIGAVDTFVLSLVLCYVREKTGNLWACIGIHAIKNGLAFVYLYIIVAS